MDPPEAHWSALRQQRAAIRDTLASYEMGLICHLPTFVHTADLTTSIREASRQEMREALSVAVALDACKVVLHPSFVGGLGRSVPDLVKRHALESLAHMARQARACGCRICLENLFERLTPFSSLDDFNAIFERWPEMAMTLDVGHAFIDGKGMGCILALIDTFGARIDHLHISDNFGRRDDHLAVGDGAIDFPALAKALQRIEYDGTMTLEVFTGKRSDLVRSRQVLQTLMGAHPG
jgi:sugar phosphate isomerase/epimerase